jgi:predicted RNA-binding Zn ribbon-like protein
MVRSENPRADPNALRLCLEFSNTVAWHASLRPEDRLITYGDLVRWAQAQKILPPPDAQKMIRAAAAKPAEAGRVLKRAAVLREAIYRIFAASAHGRPPDETDLAEVNRTIRKITSGAEVSRSAEGYAWKWNINPAALDSLLAPIALSAAELLVSNERTRVGQCADDRGCGWLFLDTSKNHTRRWCDAGDCGNRARQLRFQKRARQMG